VETKRKEIWVRLTIIHQRNNGIHLQKGKSMNASNKKQNKTIQ